MQTTGARKQRIPARMARAISPVKATSAGWQVIARAWRKMNPPVLISFRFRLDNNQSTVASDKSMQRGMLALRTEQSPDQTPRTPHQAGGSCFGHLGVAQCCYWQIRRPERVSTLAHQHQQAVAEANLRTAKFQPLRVFEIN